MRVKTSIDAVFIYKGEGTDKEREKESNNNLRNATWLKKEKK